MKKKFKTLKKKRKKKRNEQDNYIMIVRKVTLSLYIGHKYTIPFISLYIIGGRRGRDRIIVWQVDLQLHM